MPGDATRLNDLLALSRVPRWSIVPHIGSQSVSDHTFRVLVMSIELAERLQVPFSFRAVMYTLVHDADESRTSDIAASAKNILDVEPRDFCPWMGEILDGALSPEEYAIINICDKIEAFTWIERWGIGYHARSVATNCMRKIEVVAKECDREGWAPAIRQMADDIVFERGR